MPQRRAAASLEPSAKTCRPKTVLRSTSDVATARATATQTPAGRLAPRGLAVVIQPLMGEVS